MIPFDVLAVILATTAATNAIPLSRRSLLVGVGVGRRRGCDRWLTLFVQVYVLGWRRSCCLWLLWMNGLSTPLPPCPRREPWPSTPRTLLFVRPPECHSFCAGWRAIYSTVCPCREPCPAVRSIPTASLQSGKVRMQPVQHGCSRSARS
jgi:hypothetical protein